MGAPPFVPMAPICPVCDDGFTLADISELDDEDMRTVLGLEFSCCDWPKGPAAGCNNNGNNQQMQMHLNETIVNFSKTNLYLNAIL